jgi:membrane associated rhomboid family serine protease
LPLPYRWQLRLDRLKKSFGGIFSIGGGEPQPRPKICPACGSLVGINANRCHECGTSLTFSLAAIGKSLGGFISAEAPITYLIFVINILLFVVSILATNKQQGGANLFGGISHQVLLEFGARDTQLIRYGEWWRLVMPMFLHLGIFHFGMNTMVLLDFGPRVESTYGSPRFLFMYVFTGIFGFITSALWNLYWSGGFGLSAGASGALCGLLGVLLGATLGHQGRQARETRSQLTRMIAYLVLMGLIFYVDNAAHFGGLVSGMLFGKLFTERPPVNQQEIKRAYLLGFTAGIVVIASFVMMFLHLKDYAAR